MRVKVIKDVTLTIKAGQTADIDGAQLDAALRLGAVTVEEEPKKKKTTTKRAAK